MDRWTSKPAKINEVQWAKRGWSCVGQDCVGCVGGCGIRVVITLEDDAKSEVDSLYEDREDKEDEQEWRDSAQKELVEKYSEMIVTKHADGCLWRRRGCDGKISTASGSLQNRS